MIDNVIRKEETSLEGKKSREENGGLSPREHPPMFYEVQNPFFPMTRKLES
jgi:hypothetical protein